MSTNSDWALGVICLYAAVLGTGYLATGRTALGAIVLGASLVAGWATVRIARVEAAEGPSVHEIGEPEGSAA